MNLEKLHVHNWGPHKDITVDLNAPIVGIIGANGKGKSFLLQAISYAVTGTLPLAKEKYIREYDPSNEKRSGKGYKATVELHFSVGGDPGKIVRSISDSSSTRELHWKGEVYKKLADVDSIIEELLGADKAAMQNAVFIKQGELTEMVKGTPAVRQEIFRRLMNLNFLASRHEEVMSKLRLLDGMGKDVSGEVRQLSDMIDNWSKEYAKWDTTCNTLAAATEAHKLLQDLEYDNGYIRMLVFQKYKAKEEVTNLESSLVQKLNGKQLKELEEEFDEASKKLRKLEQKRDVLDELEQLQDILNTYKTQKEHNDDIHKKLNGLSLADYDNAIMFFELQHKLEENNNERSLRKSELDDAEKYVSQYSEIVDNDKAKLDNLYQDLKNIRDDIAMIMYHMDIVSGERKDAVCISCKRPLDIDHLKTMWGADDIGEHLRIVLGENQDKEQKCIAAIRELSNSITAQEEAIVKNKTTTIFNKVRIEELDAAISTGISESAKLLESNMIPVTLLPPKSADLRTFVQSLKKSKNDHSALQMSLYSDIYMEAAKKNADSAALRVQAIKEEFGELPDPDSIDKEIDDLNNFINTINITIREGKDLTNRLRTASDNVVSYTSQIVEKEKNQQALQENIKALVAQLPAEDGVTEIEDIVKAAYEKLQLGTQTVKFLKRTIDDNKEKLEKLIEIQKTNEKIAQVQQELKDVKDILARDGLPTHYMQSVFSKITSRVQQILQQIGANFQVAVDELQPCTFTFYRTDTETEYVMPQEMLSGGQAVRLALALLLACQQLILPDVGLLVLDEPTSHVDQAGVESMRALFQEMSSLLANAGMQIVVVDHNADLQAGFTKTTVL